MRLKLAFLAFIKAFKNPTAFKTFLLPHEEKKDEGKHSVEHIRLLALLQHSSRLIDFLKEDITHYSDAEVGAAVREVHQESSKLLEELVTIRPLRDEPEGSMITILKGYDPSEVHLIGNVKGDGPYKGELRHPGWKAHKIHLPKSVGDARKDVLMPAEIEVK